MTDFHASPLTWPFWRASIIVTVLGGVIGAVLAVLVG